MSRGKYLSLDEARKLGQLDRFAKEHPSQSEGDRFQQLLNRAVTGSSAAPQTSDQAASAGCSGTRTPSRTSRDAASRRERESLE